jgi:DNA-binding SARP family transcriptional activator
MMRLYFMSGDRTQALHQYQRCAAALQEELGVEPSARTVQLYEQIQSDTFIPPLFRPEKVASRREGTPPAFEDMLKQLEQFSLTLRRMEAQVQQEIDAIENILANPRNRSAR